MLDQYLLTMTRKSIQFIYKLVNVLLILTFFSIGCKNFTRNDNNLDFNYWNWVVISPENHNINIFYDSDTASIVTWDLKDTVNKQQEQVQIKTNFNRKKFVLSKKERETIFLCTYKLTKDTVKPKDFCSDYCGHATFRIKSRQISLSSSFSSICNWSKISDETKQIYMILSRKIKVNTESECVGD
jgi:hypothetical protein